MRTNNTIDTACWKYERPEIEVMDVITEGVFCVSFQTPGEDDDPYFKN